MKWTERDYLEITVDQAREQWRRAQWRPTPAEGKRQEPFLPIETLLANAASFVVDYRKYGQNNRHLVAQPIPELSRLFKRSQSSFLAKMTNLNGTMKNGARNDLMVGATLNTESALFGVVYRTIFMAARSVGIGADQLPDFLGLEVGGALTMLGQEQLTSASVDAVLERELPFLLQRQPNLTQQETERLFLSAARVGQHRFATAVLHNCGGACVFCGMTSPQGAPQSLLIASHIKPWRHGDNKERLDYRNGLAACPTHDKAFDTGLISLTKELGVKVSPNLAAHIEKDPAALAAFGSPPLRANIEFDWRQKRVGNKYVEWHRERIFQTN